LEPYFRPFQAPSKEPAIASPVESMLNSRAMSASAGKLFKIPRSSALLGSLALLLRR
jgi:hypothetical protein